MAERGHKQWEVFRKCIYTKITVRKETMRRNDFRKCSRSHHFSKIFQCVIKRLINTNSRILC